jgi:hypothetical protein
MNSGNINNMFQQNPQGGGTSIADLKKMPYLDQQISQTTDRQSPMEEIAHEVNNSLDKYGPSERAGNTEEDTNTEEDLEIEIKTKKKTFWKSLPNIIKEAVLLLTIYMFLSQEFIKKQMVSHIPLLKNNGNVSSLIYGLILIIIYLVIKYFVI